MPATSSKIEQWNISDLSAGNNKFALDLFSELGGKNENVLFSPWSIYSALAMANEGARGNTTEEMWRVLHFPDNGSQFEISFASAYDKFNSIDAVYTLIAANALWVDKENPLLPNFAADIDRYFHGTARNVDFKGAPDDAKSIINSWVESRTGSRIKNLITYISPDTQLLITNAVYFKGMWDEAFDKNMTEERNFTTSEGRIIRIPMMESQTSGQQFNYNETNDLQILELPYKGKRLSMIILLPMSNNTSSLERSLSLEKFMQWRTSLSETEVGDVRIPKFSFSSKYSLTDDLKGLGLKNTFTQGADFSGINGRTDLFISDVIHQSFVDVNEQGTEAAAATGASNVMACMPGYGPPDFWADHPFIFFIQDKETGTILFMGRVSDPGRIE
ncbi:MAG TPA: serpin family protein [Methanothrix sp.]|nr:serpin family protein [Methanothrix sp.]